MAETLYAINDPEDLVQWSSSLNHEAIQRTLFLKRFAGPGKNMPIQILDDLSEKAGSTVHVFMRPKGTGKGRKGDDTLEGHEERLNTHRDTIIIDQLRHAFKDGGKMSQQRVTWNVRAEGRDALADWWAEKLDEWFANILTSNTTETDTRATGLQATTAATTVRRAAGDANDQTLHGSATSILKPADIDWMVNKAQIMSPPIRPVSIDGQDHYIFVIHSNTYRTMRDVSGEFHAVWKSGMQGGVVSDNPIITGASIVWNNVVIYVNNRLPQGIHSSTGAYQTNVRTGVFMGAQAAALAFGRGFGKNRFSYNELELDYGNKYGVAAGLIAGAKKLVFNSADYGVIRYASYAPDPA